MNQLLTAILVTMLGVCGVEVNLGQLQQDIVWVRWADQCFWIDLTKRKDGPKLPQWMSLYDTIYFTYNYHVVKGNWSPFNAADTAFCTAKLNTDTSALPNSKTVFVAPLAITPGGTLVNGTDTWTFGSQTSTGGNALLLNGNLTGGYGTKLQLSNGKIYTLTLQNTWYFWNGSWAPTSAP